jgi:hypothetical protein
VKRPHNSHPVKETLAAAETAHTPNSILVFSIFPTEIHYGGPDERSLIMQ